jgi:hypothetical protein
MTKDTLQKSAARDGPVDKGPRIVCVSVEPGACGFPCTIRAKKTDRRTVAVTISGSQCRQIQKLSGCVTVLSMKELFIPLTRNPVYTSAEKTGCHSSCAVPSAILKAAEVAMEMAVPRDVQFQITCPQEDSD